MKRKGLLSDAETIVLRTCTTADNDNCHVPIYLANTYLLMLNEYSLGGS